MFRPFGKEKGKIAEFAVAHMSLDPWNRQRLCADATSEASLTQTPSGKRELAEVDCETVRSRGCRGDLIAHALLTRRS